MVFNNSIISSSQKLSIFKSFEIEDLNVFLRRKLQNVTLLVKRTKNVVVFNVLKLFFLNQITKCQSALSAGWR